MKILFNTPRLIPQGGVTNHYIGLKQYWTSEVLYNPIGKRSNRSGSGIFLLPINLITFIYRIFSFQPDIIVLNPSLSRAAMIRDMLFLRVAKMFGCRVSVFIHGFNEASIPHLNLRRITALLNRTECVFVLASRFRDILRSWGVRVPIHLTTTKVDDSLLENFTESNRKCSVRDILFLARVTEEKGIFIALQCYRLLKEKYHELCFHVVGDGPALESARKFVFDNDIKDVFFYGALAGEEVAKAYSSADVYLFPTYHEGMPTSVLEAMAFGLPVVTRPVGGLVDFFENGKMGEMVDSMDACDFARAIEFYIANSDKAKSVSDYNAEYARTHFLASKVAVNFEEILRKYI